MPFGVGDPLQLGAVVQSAYAKSFGLGESLLERFLKRFPYMRDQEGFPETGGYDPRLVTRLVYNYRNLPEILSLSSNLFYDGEVKATVTLPLQPPPLNHFITRYLLFPAVAGR